MLSREEVFFGFIKILGILVSNINFLVFNVVVIFVVYIFVFMLYGLLLFFFKVILLIIGM